MKFWKKPEAIGQEFVANDYVSACTISVKCDFWPSDSNVPEFKWSGPIQRGLDIPGSDAKLYTPCGADHVHNVNVNDFQSVTFSSGYDSSSWDSTTFYYEPVTVSCWYDSDGDFHATSTTAEQIAEANKS